ncbi:hypothetical protein BJ322DRAFT_1105482 [Thelephora terrestris]|uniref:Uncharacterized protein n=1 Tax=Thelephora terrestris TaxID=56493 RepID=A0A9P6HLC8_9AGAM|nr:hypothetical protein BJ322DRAFT_1105482 [Thelephora terrestris]
MTPVEDWVYKEERSLLSFPHSQSLLYSSTSTPLNKQRILLLVRSVWEYKLIRSLQVNRTAGLLTHFPYYRPFVALDSGVTTPPFLLGADHQFLWNSDTTESVLATVYFSISPAFYFPNPRIHLTTNVHTHSPAIIVLWWEIPTELPYSVLEYLVSFERLSDQDFDPFIQRLSQFCQDYHSPFHPYQTESPLTLDIPPSLTSTPGTPFRVRPDTPHPSANPLASPKQGSILEIVKEVDAERLRETIPHLMGLTWDNELWVRSMIAKKVIFQMRGRFGELEHPIKKELWYTLQRGIYDQELLEHGATIPRAVHHATASTTLLWSLVRGGESKVERLEREVKEAKADVLRLSAEGLLMKETLAAFQQGTNEALEAMVANHQELVAGLKVRDNNIKGALARRDEKTEQLEDVVAVLTAQVASLQDKTCNCKEGPVLVGQGTADVPFELEYADEVVLPSPNPSSYAMPPVENSVPVPTPALASTLAESDKENCWRCPLQPISQLVKIEDEVMEVDRAEDVPRAIELSRMVTSLGEMRDDPSATGSTVPTDRSSRRSSFATSFDSQDRIPPRGPTRETEGRSSTVSIVLPSNHPVMEMWDQVFQSSVTSGRLIGPLEGVSSYRLELVVQLSAEDGDAMFGEVLARRGQHYDLRDGQLMTFRPAVDRVDF